MKTDQKTQEVMDADAIRKAIRRIAHEIVERNPDLSRLVIAGIPTRGVKWPAAWSSTSSRSKA